MVRRLLPLALLALGCGDDARVALRADDAATADAGPRCDRAEDCDDGDPCTEDLCVVGNVCDRERRSGCVTPRACTRAADCDDGVPCTRDRCLVTGRCDSVADDALCPVGERCAAPRGCVAPLDAGPPPADVPAPRDAPPPMDLTLLQGDVITPADVVTAPSDVPAVTDAAPDPRAGVYTLVPAAAYACQDEVFKTPIVSLAVASVRLAITAARTEATWPGGPVPLTGPAPAGSAFRVTGTIPHEDCATTLTLSGTFTDAQRFSGTLALSFSGVGCALTSCEARAFTVNGTRAP